MLHNLIRLKLDDELHCKNSTLKHVIFMCHMFVFLWRLISTFIIVEAQQTRFRFLSVLLLFLLFFVDLDSTRLESVSVVVQYICSRSGTGDGLARVRRLFSAGPAGLLDLLLLLIVRLIPPPEIAPLSFLKHGDEVCNASKILYTD